MKKLLLLLVAFATISMTAQVTLFEDDFEAYTATDNVGEQTDIPTGYIGYDEDGDNIGWGVSTPANFTQPFADIYTTGNFITSASYVTTGAGGNGGDGELSPDNILVLPMISIPSGATDVNLNYFVGSGTDPNFFSESYSVQVTATSDVATILAATPLLDTTLSFQGGEDVSINLDAFIGQDVYVSFRHYNTINEWLIGLDNITVIAASVAGDIVSLIGTGSPTQSWDNATGDTDMVDLGGGLYELNGASIYDGALKFRQNHEWTVNWGSDTFPSGTAVQNGPDIPSTVGTYDITFNVNTGDYVFTATASVNDLEAVGFTYAPNPAANFLNMKANAAINNVVFYNILGEKVLQVTPNNLESNVDVSRLSAGAYFVQVQVGDSNGTFKVIKK